MSATPRPWQRDERGFSDVYIMAADRQVVATVYGHFGRDTTEANSHLIVRAVNAHEELLEAADNLISILYSTDTDLTGEQERAVEGLLYAATKAKGSA